MGILDWLFMGPTERTLGRVPKASDPKLAITELRQAQVLDRMSRYDAEHVNGWTGPNHDQPVFEYRDLSDIWKDSNEKQSRG